MVVKEIPRASKSAHPSTSRGDTNRKRKPAAEAFHLACIALSESSRPKGSSRGTRPWGVGSKLVGYLCTALRAYLGMVTQCFPPEPQDAMISLTPDVLHPTYLTKFCCSPRARQSSIIRAGNLIVLTATRYPCYAFPPYLIQPPYISRPP
jgi:hypothetical protein